MDETIEVLIESIVVGHRFRQDFGDITSLIEKIAAVGLSRPVGIDKDKNLIFGQMNMEACRSLGWQSIPARIVDISAILAERDHSTVSEGFTISERVDIGMAIEELLAEQGADHV